MDRIGIIGGGVIAEAIMKGLIGKGFDPQNLLVSDVSKERLQYLQETLGIKTAIKNKEVIPQCDVIVLAVKPQNMNEALTSFTSVFTPEKLLISILAGISTTKIEKILPPDSKVIRAMPNTPALIGAGTTVLTAGLRANKDDLRKAVEIFETVGSVTILPEKMLNAVTGLSGSGPAYIYIIIEALADGGVLAGLPRDTALKLATETVKGAAMMVSETKKHPGELKDMVTSPGGTAIAGLLQMEEAGLRGVIMDAVMAASRRSAELAQ